VTDTPRFALLAGAWLLTYLIHSSVLLGGAVLLSRALGKRFERIAETTWRVAMFGAIATTFVQLAWLSSPAILLTLSEKPHRSPAANGAWQAPWSAGEASADAWRRALPVLLLVWVTVALVRLVMLARAQRALTRATSDRISLSDVTIAARVRALGGGTVPLVSISRRSLTPMVIGHRELCLPERALHDLSHDELDAVLAHEIAHIVRRDRAWLSIASLIERVLFLQPLNSVAATHMRAVAECSCDDWALRRTGKPIALASALARVTEWLAGAPAEAFAVGMASRESLALARVRRILDPSAQRYSDERRPLRILAAGGVVSAMILLAPSVAVSHEGLHALSLETPVTRYTIRAVDDGGHFTLTLDGGRAVAMTIDGESLDPRRLLQSGDELRVTDARGQVMFAITLTPAGGIRWTSRPKPLVASR
jgi:beta-lactamase regulating signal transducer with metallopeptidase domain